MKVDLPQGRIHLHLPDRITAEDAARQEATVREILRRLETQPGLILADEVGMGKTFVALAVAVSVILHDLEPRPVVVMVPPALEKKWPTDFGVFAEHCLSAADRAQIRERSARSGLEFFRLLDDPLESRANLIFLTHGAFHRSLQDPWIKLAILREALRVPRLEAKRNAMAKFAADILLLASRYRDPTLFEDLLDSRYSKWKAVLLRHGVEIDDDPVPEQVAQVLRGGAVNFRELRETLLGMPERDSIYRKERLTEVRRSLAYTLQENWRTLLREARFSAPLLILDEAHHLKNPRTQLASLFVEPEAAEEMRWIGGALANRFDRMIFLTATPFQLGHSELLNVLNRFRGVNWENDLGVEQRAQFDTSLVSLERALNAAQLATAQFDMRWKKVEPDDLEMAGASNWSELRAREDLSEKMQFVMRGYDEALRCMKEAETLLRPWVIRHLRAREFPAGAGPRRRVYTGAGTEAVAGAPAPGLDVRDGAVLPFLLAARSQALVARLPVDSAQRTRRALFAEGLASSYEAFLETRRTTLNDGRAQSVFDLDAEQEDGGQPYDVRLEWYLQKLKETLPSPDDYQGHPKIAWTIDRALDLWLRGEKVLIFCHFTATGRALRRHIAARIEQEILRRIREHLGEADGEIRGQLERLSRRFDSDRPLGRTLDRIVNESLSRAPELAQNERERIQEVVRRFVRTPSFLVRFYLPGGADSAEQFAEALHGADASGQALRHKIDLFVEFLSRRCTAEERDQYLDALESISVRWVWTDEEEGADDATTGRFPPVRLADGKVDQDARRRIMLCFNTPFFPEILIASSVFAEGVDLQRNCRYVIHHDLSWNPSTLEQRTGRVDRIGAKAEQVTRPVEVFLPYIAETQDEKMFRVVRDRERWFQVLMGENYSIDELATDVLAKRVPLPAEAAEALAYRLEVWRDSRSPG